jgi:hypothetical protein
MEKKKEEEDHENLLKENEKNNKIIEKLQNEVDKFEAINIEHKENTEKLSKLYELGVIDSSSDYIHKENDNDDNTF